MGPAVVTPTSLVDRSGATVVAFASQVLLLLDPHRRGWRLMNTSDAELWFNDTGGPASAGGTGCYRIDAGDYFESPPSMLPCYPVSICGPKAGQPFSAAEW